MHAECMEIHLAAGCPPESRGCDSLFHLPYCAYMHNRGKNSLSSDRASLREATEGVMESVEFIRTGASSSSLFLTTDRLHLTRPRNMEDTLRENHETIGYPNCNGYYIY